MIEAYEKSSVKLNSWRSIPPALLKEMEAKTGLEIVAIKKWFTNREYRLTKKAEKMAKSGKKSSAEPSHSRSHEEKSVDKAKEKSSKNREKPTKKNSFDKTNGGLHWVQDPTLPADWTFCRINGQLFYRGPDGREFDSRVAVIKTLNFCE